MFDPNQSMNIKTGTPYYIAPEVIKKSYDSNAISGVQAS